MAKRPLQIPNRSEITDDTPLRLAVAAAVAFPDGSMTASGLRRERDAGRLVTEMIAGREFTTLGYIVRMRELCRRQVDPASDARSGFRCSILDGQVASSAHAAALFALNRRKAELDAKQQSEKVARENRRNTTRTDRLQSVSSGRRASTKAPRC